MYRVQFEIHGAVGYEETIIGALGIPPAGYGYECGMGALSDVLDIAWVCLTYGEAESIQRVVLAACKDHWEATSHIIDLQETEENLE
jgi:hypothetical protein